jgi:hypothetical protein
MYSMETRIKNGLYALAGYQIFGGILGIALAGRALPQLKSFSEENLPLVLFAGLLYIYSILCGVVLFKDFRRGLRLSLVNQVLQVLSFAIGSFAYNFVAGFKVGFGIHFIPAWQLKLNLSLSSFQFILNEDTGQVLLGINLLALILVYLIERLKERLFAGS